MTTRSNATATTATTELNNAQTALSTGEARQNRRRGWRYGLSLLGKALCTALVFYALLTHPIEVNGERIPVAAALLQRARFLPWRSAVPWLALGALLKAIGVACAIARWHMLLAGQGVRFNIGHTVRTFLIGRFIGTFLPGTVGLDGYKLYDVARHTGAVAAAAAATVVEKLMGLAGIMLTYLLAAPFGYRILREAAPLTLALTVPLGLLSVGMIAFGLTRPRYAVRAMAWVAMALPRRWRHRTNRLVTAMGSYDGQLRVLWLALGLSFGVHFTTASLYFCTALAVGAAQARFGEVVFASSIQIFATVVSPLTIAGEGVREAVQALLLARQIGASESILSAALGFWAAEALTLVGGVFWWTRDTNYRPDVMSAPPLH